MNRPAPERHEPETRPRRRRALAWAIAGAALTTALAALLTPSAAQAGNVHLIQTANSPSTGAPIAGGGSWITNRYDAYYIGRAMPGTRFDNEVTEGHDWHYGRAIDGVDMCGWVMRGSMGSDAGTVADSCSSSTAEALSHRLTIGRDYNAPAHEATDGGSVPAGSSCQLYYNYFHGSDFTSNGGRWADPASGTTSSSVQYRFTTRDRQAVVVRDPNLGWGFLPIGCVTRPTALYNDND